MKTIKNIFLFSALVLIFAACEKEKLSNGHSDLIVVEGYLYGGVPVDSIRLSKPDLLNSADTIFHGITNASVSISTDGTTFQLLPSLKQGYFYCHDANLKIIAGKTYNLDVIYNNTHITSQTSVPDNPANLRISNSVLAVDTTLSMRTLRDTIYSLTVRWSNPNNDYFMAIVENTASTLTPITVNNPYGGGYNTNGVNFARSTRSSPTQNTSFRISIFSTVGNYGNYQFKLYKVTKDYTSLYQSRNQSSTSLQEPFTNINNGLGIFTAFSACDSISFSVVKKM